MRYRVIQPHDASYTDPLAARAGDALQCGRVEKGPPEWPGWVWCTGPDGRSGWVPEGWLRIDGESSRLLRDYDAVELTAGVGEVLTGSVVAAGWLWAASPRGERGWVPLECLEALEETGDAG